MYTTMVELLEPFLRKCCLLLYAFTPQEDAEEHTLLPQTFDKLRSFLELPDLADFESIYSILPSTQLFIEKAQALLFSSLLE